MYGGKRRARVRGEKEAPGQRGITSIISAVALASPISRMNLLPSKLLWRRARTAAHLRPIAGLSSSAPDHIPDLRELTTGLQFPVDPSGSRSTTHAGKSLLSAALRGGGTPEGDALAARVEAEDNWRFRYPEHFLALVRYAASR